MNNEIQKLVESISDADKVPAYQNGFFVLTPEELEAFHRAAEQRGFNRGIEAAAKRCDVYNSTTPWASSLAAAIRALEMKPC